MQAMRDYIFPIITAKKISDDTIEYRNLKGTGFLIGNRNFALTATHVINQCKEQPDLSIFALFYDDGKWAIYPLIPLAEHPKEDVTLVKIESMKPLQAFVSIVGKSEHASHEIMSWGYPIYVAEEIQKLKEKATDPNERPDLVYFKGYIRRRVSRELGFSVAKGTQFYEIDRALGNGVSGAPVFSLDSKGQKKWNCIGVYVAEGGDKSDQHGFVVRSDAFYSWSPKELGRTIEEESNQ